MRQRLIEHDARREFVAKCVLQRFVHKAIYNVPPELARLWISKTCLLDAIEYARKAPIPELEEPRLGRLREE